MEEKKSIIQSVEQLQEEVKNMKKESEKKKLGKFKFPWKIRSQFKRMHKKNRALVLFLKNNRAAEMKICSIYDEVVEVDGEFYDASTHFFYMYQPGNIPLMVLPEYSLTPIGTKDYHDAVKAGNVSSPQKFMIRIIEMKEAMAAKGKFGGQSVVLMIIGAVVVGYLLFGGNLG